MVRVNTTCRLEYVVSGTHVGTCPTTQPNGDKSNVERDDEGMYEVLSEALNTGNNLFMSGTVSRDGSPSLVDMLSLTPVHLIYKQLQMAFMCVHRKYRRAGL